MLRVYQSVARPALAGAARRTYVTSEVYNREEVAIKVKTLKGSLQGTNWADYLNLVQNVPFWECELERIATAASPYLADPELGKDMDEIHRTFDVLYACEDVRDHLNEIMEVSTRTTGIMGIGIFSGDTIDNVEELIENVVHEYDDLLVRYPDFKPKIEQTVGHGLGLMRQKYKFRFGSMHRFFF